jgi:LPXTG-motif cell wall-anchored protein
MASRRVVCALAALVLALPSAAWAQGAGDEQYQDPFGDEGAQPEPQGGDQDDSQGEAPAGDDGAVAPAAPEAAPAQPAQSAPAEQLPYTGADTALVGLGGALLVAGGVVLRVRLRLSERRPLSR